MKQWYYAVTGGYQGPISGDQLQAMALSGTLKSDQYVWTEGMAEWLPARTVPGLFASQPGLARGVAAHRGILILVLGILGLVICFIIGIFAWTMGNQDLREMAAGRMDPSGEGLTKAGKICGMVSVLLAVGSLLLFLVGVVIATFL